MAIDKKKLRRVEKFEELALGMRVVVDCGWGCHMHSGILIRFTDSIPLIGSNEDESEEPAYMLSVLCHGEEMWVPPTSVAEGAVYRYAEDIESGEEVTVSLRARGGVLEVV